MAVSKKTNKSKVVAYSNAAGVKLNEQELDYVDYVTQHYFQKGTPPVPETKEETVFAQKCFAKKSFREALEERGIIFRKEINDFKKYTLSPEQLLVANAILDYTDTRSQKKKLQDCEVSTQQFQQWMRDPVFVDYLNERSAHIIDNSAFEINNALMDEARRGNIKAIEYVNEMTGRYIPIHKRVGHNQSGVDVHGLIMKIIEIIQVRVTDPEVQLAISEDVSRLIAAQNTASALLGSNDGSEQLTKQAKQVTAKDAPVELGI